MGHILERHLIDQALSFPGSKSEHDAGEGRQEDKTQPFMAKKPINSSDNVCLHLPTYSEKVLDVSSYDPQTFHNDSDIRLRHRFLFSVVVLLGRRFAV
jgi:hypothetical protein